MKRITVIGAGNVGATCVNELARRQVAQEIVVVDLNEGAANGKALDIFQTAPILSFSTRVTSAGNDYTKTKDSGLVIITAGLPRKPGMSRDDLIGANAKIMKSVAELAVKNSPEATFLIVTNPLDVMTYAALLACGRPENKVIGMAGVLDTARYKAFIAEELNVSPRNIEAILMGGHGDTMVPLPRYTSVAGVPVTELIPQQKLDAIVERTRKGGGEILAHLGTSAWYAPGASAANMAEAIVRNERRIVSACAALNGEYGMKNLHLGVPVVLGENGVEKVIELQLNEQELALLRKSAEAVKSVMVTLDDMNLFEKKMGSLPLNA